MSRISGQITCPCQLIRPWLPAAPLWHPCPALPGCLTTLWRNEECSPSHPPLPPLPSKALWGFNSSAVVPCSEAFLLPWVGQSRHPRTLRLNCLGEREIPSCDESAWKMQSLILNLLFCHTNKRPHQLGELKKKNISFLESFLILPTLISASLPWATISGVIMIKKPGLSQALSDL